MLDEVEMKLTRSKAETGRGQLVVASSGSAPHHVMSFADCSFPFLESSHKATRYIRYSLDYNIICVSSPDLYLWVLSIPGSLLIVLSIHDLICSPIPPPCM